MAGNSGYVEGGVARSSSHAAEMRAYDGLPPELRRVISGAKLEWPCTMASDALAAGYPASAVIEQIEMFEARL